MKIASLNVGSKGLVGYLSGNRFLNLTKALHLYQTCLGSEYQSIPDMIDHLLRSEYLDLSKLDGVHSFVEAHHLERYLDVGDDYSFRPPIRRPGKIIALGRNYALHAREGKNPVPEEPIIFAKPSSSLIGHKETILIPRDVGRVEHEIELGVVIGKGGKGISREMAFNHVMGYTIVNDVTERQMQGSDIEKKLPWFRSKGFDTFAPMGPWIVTADEIPPPVHLDLELSVNGQIRQKSNTSNMIFDVPTLIEFISRYMTLEPGDIISTGTPEGVGPIGDGDNVTCLIRGIGELVNPVKVI
jgi:2-keto-4-pentenoate hydratase/2-oxohepta-3-ene-1,7-dioic acid hydratase in catechol pathway